MARQLFILRHGRSQANERGLIASTMANAGEAFGLTAEGREEVRSSVIDQQSRLVAPTLILSSPLLRTRETAEIAAELCGVSVHVDDRLVERGFGAFEMQSADRYEFVWDVDRRDPTHRTWGVESVGDVLTRLRSLLDETPSEGDGSTLLVTHGDVASTLICASLGEDLSRHREVGGLTTGQLVSVDWPST